MKNKFIILGSGSSLGSPWITNNWGSCDKKNVKNLRTRCSAFIKFKDLSIAIDTSPDIKLQFKQNSIKNLDAIIYTHEHADQTSGIFELRPFFWKNKKKIPVYADKKVIKELKEKYTYCFKEQLGYKPIMTANNIKNKFSIKKNNTLLKFNYIKVKHGQIYSSCFVFNKIAYVSDCSHIPEKSYRYLKNLNFLIVDCLQIKKHPSHFNLDEALKLSNDLKPRKTILTNLHITLDYAKLKKILPKNVVPAFDGFNFSF